MLILFLIKSECINQHLLFSVKTLGIKAGNFNSNSFLCLCYLKPLSNSNVSEFAFILLICSSLCFEKGKENRVFSKQQILQKATQVVLCNNHFYLEAAPNFDNVTVSYIRWLILKLLREQFPSTSQKCWKPDSISIPFNKLTNKP